MFNIFLDHTILWTSVCLSLIPDENYAVFREKIPQNILKGLFLNVMFWRVATFGKGGIVILTQQIILNRCLKGGSKAYGYLRTSSEAKDKHSCTIQVYTVSATLSLYRWQSDSIFILNWMLKSGWVTQGWQVPLDKMLETFSQIEGW